MDERQLAELFRAATDGGPPPSFGHSDVVAASRRATVRRRVALAGGSALGVAVLLGGVLVGGGFFDGSPPDELTAAQPGSASSEASPHIESAPDQGDPERAEPSVPPNSQAPLEIPGDQSQGTGTSGLVVPWPGLGDDDARAGCGRADRELADALAAELPAAAGTEAQAVPDECPPDARAVAVPVLDGETPGRIYVVLAPVRGDGPADQPVQRAEDGARGFHQYTPRGQVLLVLSVPSTPGGPLPFASQTMRLAERIGSKY